MQKKVSSNSSITLSCCLSLLFLFLVSFILYCLFSFPHNLKYPTAELFQSHQPEDLTKYILPENTLKKAKYVKNDLLNQCQDIQVNSQGVIYCGGYNGSIIQVDMNNNKIVELAHLQGNNIYGLRLSRDQKILYFISVKNGLSMLQLSTLKVTHLVTYYDNKFLYALNSIQTDPSDSNILYFDQSFDDYNMDYHHIDLMINRPNGHLFKYFIKQNITELICDGLHFANGLIYQKYQHQQTILVAQTNRFRIIRVYLSGQNKGKKQVAIDKLDIYLDNMKQNEYHQILIGGPSIRDNLLYWLDYQPDIRNFVARLPKQIIQIIRDKKMFGGVKIKFNNIQQQQENNVKDNQHTVKYLFWRPLDNISYSFATTLLQKNNKLYISSLKSNGIFIFDNMKQLENIIDIKIKTQIQRKQKQIQL